MNKRQEGELYKRLKERKKEERKQHVGQVSPYSDLLKKTCCPFSFSSKYSSEFEYI